jgi:isochorismate synthase
MDGVTLTEEYRPGSFFFAAPEHTLLPGDPKQVLSEKDTGALAGQVTELLAGTRGIAAGALPYDVTGEAHVGLSESAHWSGPVDATAQRRNLLSGYRVTPVPAPEDYEHQVTQALALLSAGRLEKVVLARTLQVDLDEPVDIGRILGNLAAINSHGFIFAAPLPAPGTTLVGASPELLIRRTGRTFVSNPLAGSQPRGDDPVTDRANAQALLASKKDHDEHRPVVEAVVAALRPYCRRLSVPRSPSLVSTPSMWHLATKITGELTDPDVTALTLAGALHPTPAICGTPPDAACQAIAELEPVDRGFYAGAVGWVDAAGDGEWAVSIRSAEVSERSLRLYAGAGIIGASQPELELAETSAKFQTLLRGVGLDIQV